MIGHLNASKMGFKLMVLCINITLGFAEFLALQRSRYRAWRAQN
ncbi:MAG: hypothetical protein JWP79_2696 [Polaromonas sp.]|jgi:hypothetical protein|nr:hypothetical protein [Polaromonas sp.]MDB5940295.1 hypothetical protein [Polaromonas sp.]